MSVTLSLEQSYRLLRSLGSIPCTPLNESLKIGILNQEVVVLQNPPSTPDNLEQLHPLVNCAAKKIIEELRVFLPRIGSAKEKIVAIHERLTTLTNAWSTLHKLSQICDHRVFPIFTQTIDSLKQNYDEGRSFYYHYIREAHDSVPEEYQWLLKEQEKIIDNFRENNDRLRARRDLMGLLLRGVSSEKDQMEARVKELAAENRNYQDQNRALEFSSEVVIEARAFEKASVIQYEFEAQKQRVVNLEVELNKARTRLRIIFLFISTVSVLTLFFSRRKRS